MISQKNTKRLNNLISKYAYRDYLAYNKGYKRHHPYTLSQDTNDARAMYYLALKGEDIAPEEEESVKAYINRKMILGELDSIMAAESEGRKYNPAIEIA